MICFEGLASDPSVATGIIRTVKHSMITCKLDSMPREDMQELCEIHSAFHRQLKVELSEKCWHEKGINRCKK